MRKIITINSIKKDYLPTNTMKRSGKLISKVGFITAHDTGNPNSTAKNNVDYYKREANKSYPSAHIFVDDKEAIECIPAFINPEKAWHVLYNVETDNEIYGDDANDISIGIECCYFPNDKERTLKSYHNYLWVIGEVYHYHKLDGLSKDIVGHLILDPNRKIDPNSMLKVIGKNYEDFLDDLDNYLPMHNMSDNDKIEYMFGKLFGETKRDDVVDNSNNNFEILKRGMKGDKIKELQKMLNIEGAGLIVDGSFGGLTESAVNYFKEAVGYKKDGIVDKDTWDKLVEVTTNIDDNKDDTTNENEGDNLVIIKLGDRSQIVSQWQHILNKNFGEKLATDGSFGNLTRNATIRTQQVLGLTANGIVDEKTWELAEEFEPQFINIKYGDKGLRVRELQRNLNKCGYNIAVDDSFGRITKSTVLGFQAKVGLPRTGIVDENTWNEIIKYPINHPQLVEKYWYDKQTLVVKVKKDKVKMEVIMGRQPVESLTSMYNRLPQKPLLLFNNGMFGMSNGVTLSYIKDEYETITEGIYSRYAICQYRNGDINLQGMSWAKTIGEYDDIKEATGGQPTMIINFEKRMDKTGLDYWFINSLQPRLGFGMDDEYLYVVVVHGRNKSKSYYGMTLNAFADLGMKLKLRHFINLDGGGSIKVMDENGKDLDDNPENRKVDNMIGLFPK